MNQKNLIKISVIFIVLIVIFISFNSIFEYYSFQKVYNSIDDKKLALNFENKLEVMANTVKNTGKPLNIYMNELTNNRQTEKICIIGPYNPNLNNSIKIDWKHSNLWKSTIINNDSLFSVFLINKNVVIPIKIERKAINNYITSSSCTYVKNNTRLELIKNNELIYLKVIEK